MVDNKLVGPGAVDWVSLIQRVMVAFEVMGGYMPRDEKVQAVMQNGRLALRELGEAACPAAQGEGYNHENLAGEQRRPSGGGGRGGVGNQER